MMRLWVNFLLISCVASCGTYDADVSDQPHWQSTAATNYPVRYKVVLLSAQAQPFDLPYQFPSLVTLEVTDKLGQLNYRYEDLKLSPPVPAPVREFSADVVLFDTAWIDDSVFIGLDFFYNASTTVPRVYPVSSCQIVLDSEEMAAPVITKQLCGHLVLTFQIDPSPR